jgi:hypothetical protein
MHEAILHRSSEHHLRSYFCALYVLWRRRHLSDCIIREDPLHLFAPFAPLLRVCDPGPVVHHHHIGRVFANGELIHSWHSAKGCPDRRNRDLPRIGNASSANLLSYCCRSYKKQNSNSCLKRHRESPIDSTRNVPFSQEIPQIEAEHEFPLFAMILHRRRPCNATAKITDHRDAPPVQRT